MATDQAGNGARGNGKAELDELIRSKEQELAAPARGAQRRWEEGRSRKALEKSGERRESSRPSPASRPTASTRPSTSRDLDYVRDLGFPGEYPFTRGIQPTMYRGRPLDDPPVRRLRHARGDQRALQVPARRRASRASRPRSTCRPRWGSTPTTSAPPARSARWASRSTRSPTWRRVFDGIPLDQRLDLDDDQRAGAGPGRDVRRGRRQAGRPAREGLGHRAERRAEGVRRARHLHLPAASRRCGWPPT